MGSLPHHTFRYALARQTNCDVVPYDAHIGRRACSSVDGQETLSHAVWSVLLHTPSPVYTCRSCLLCRNLDYSTFLDHRGYNSNQSPSGDTSCAIYLRFQSRNQPSASVLERKSLLYRYPQPTVFAHSGGCRVLSSSKHGLALTMSFPRNSCERAFLVVPNDRCLV